MGYYGFFIYFFLFKLIAGAKDPTYPLEKGHLKEELSPEFSNEGKGTSGILKYPVAGILCLGNFCDTKRLITFQRDNSPILSDKGISETKWTSTFRKPIDCPHGALVSEMKCAGVYCSYVKLGCAKPVGGYVADSADVRHSEYFSEEDVTGSCPDTYYMAGLECKGSFCDELRLKCIRLYTTIPFVTHRKICSILKAPDLFRAWTPYFSDESGGLSTAVSRPIDGIFCAGRHCDNKTLRTLKSDLEAVMEEKGSEWSNFISEEGKNQVMCPESYLVSQLECDGDYCDNIRVKCSPVKSSFIVQSSGEKKAMTYAAVKAGEGVQVPLCPYGEYMAGLQCFEDYCGMPLLVCRQVTCNTVTSETTSTTTREHPSWVWF